MAGLLWALFAVALGGLLVYRFVGFAALQPRWAAWLLTFGAGVSLGIGLTSVVFFLLRLALPAVPGISVWLEIALLVGIGYEIFRTRKPAAVGNTKNGFLLNLLLACAVLLALAVATIAMAGAWEANPWGNWDAWSIWNLRARFLATGGELSHRAWAPTLGSHPEYPLLISAFVARCWVYGHSMSAAVPIATSYLYLLALLSLTAGGLAVLRSQSLGWLGGLAILGTPAVLHEVPAQYADIPLGCYMAGALLFLLLEHPVLGGVLASMAAWTKDEGLLFLAVFLAMTAAFRGRQVLRAGAGALPVSILVIAFKAVLVRGTPSLLGVSVPGFLSRIEVPGRYWQIIGAFGSGFASMASGWYHPLWPVLVLVFVLRFDRTRRQDLLFSGGICALMLAGYFTIYLITANDLMWQLQTSLGRLLVQLWPCFLVAFLVSLRTPESLGWAPLSAGAQPQAKRASRNTKAPRRR